MADKKIGKYEILDRVGSGDMGTVYKAKDRLGRFVAIKVISADRKVTEEFKTRFLSEAQASAGLTHPNIAGIIDIDEEKDLLYTVMELLEGSDLKKILAEKQDVSVEDKINAMMQAASALQHAHEKNVTHGNLKPGKVVLQKDGTTKLVDFGGSRVAATTPGGVAASSLRYMSPEQIAGTSDAKADQYALAAVFYEALSGTPPFAGNDAKQLAEQVKTGKPKPLAELEPGLPADLVKIIEKAMSKSPGDRYANLAAMRAELEPVLKRLGDEAKGLKEKIGGVLAELARLEGDVAKRLGLAAPAAAAAAVPEHYLALTRRSKEATARIAELKEKAAKLDKAEPQLQAGTKLLGENKFAEARKELEAVVALVPEHNAAKEALEKAKKGEEQEKNRQAVRKLIDDAKKALETKNPDAAVASLEKVAAIPGAASFEAEIITVRNDAKKLKEELEAKKLARQFAERARATVVDAKLPAESQGAPKYSTATWTKANEETTRGNNLFQQEKYAESQAAFEAAAKLFTTSAEEARQGREKERREAEEAENQRRLKATNEILGEAKKHLADKAYAKGLDAIARAGKVPPPDAVKGEVAKLKEQIEAAHQTELRAKKPAQTARLLMTETRASAVAEGAEGRKSPQWVEGEAKSTEGTAAFEKEHFVDAHTKFEAAVVAYQGALDDARKAKAKAAEEAEAARKKAEAEGRSQVANTILGQAREAMQRGDITLCLDLLDAAGKVSPSPEAAKEIATLREAAQKTQKEKQSADAAKQAAEAEKQKAEKARDLVIEAVRVLHGQSTTDTSSKVWDEMEAKVAEAHTAFGKGNYAAAFSAYEAGLALCQKFEDDMRASQKKEAEAKAAAEKAAAAAPQQPATPAQQPGAPAQGAKPVGAPPPGTPPAAAKPAGPPQGAQPGAKPAPGAPPAAQGAKPVGAPPAQPAQPAQPVKGAPPAAAAAGTAAAAGAAAAAKAATPPAGQQAKPAPGAAPAQTVKAGGPTPPQQPAQAKAAPAQQPAAKTSTPAAAPAAGGAAAAASASAAAKSAEPAKPATPTVKTDPEQVEEGGGAFGPVVVFAVLAVASVLAVLFMNIDVGEAPKTETTQQAPVAPVGQVDSAATRAAEDKAAADAKAAADKKAAEDARAESEAKLAAETKAAADAKADADAKAAAEAKAAADAKVAAEGKAADEAKAAADAKAAEEARVAAEKAAAEKAAAEAKAAEEAKKAAEEKVAAEAKAAEAATAAKAAAEAKAAADAKAAEAAAAGTAAPVQIKAYASVYNEPTDGKHSGGAWGACWRGDLAAAQACAKASCERTRSSDQPCSESASAEPGGHCAVASASGFGVSWGSCSTTQAAAESAAIAGCRSQTNRRYPGENASCRIAWSSTPK
jgi:hypothetical protein